MLYDRLADEVELSRNMFRNSWNVIGKVGQDSYSGKVSQTARQEQFFGCFDILCLSNVLSESVAVFPSKGDLILDRLSK